MKKMHCNDKKSFLSYWKEYINTIINDASRRSHTAILNKLEKYLSSICQSDLLFREVTPGLLKKFKKYLVEYAAPKPITENSAIHYFRIIRAIINKSISDNYYVYSNAILECLNSIILLKND